MPLRLYRRIRIDPGVRINLSKSGPSLSVGRRGARVTVGHGRRRATVGMPGTGLSYTTYSHAHARHATVARTHPRVAARTPVMVTDPRAAAPMLPGQKIGLGVFFTLSVVGIPLGIPLLIMGLMQRHQPAWQIRGLVRKASRTN